MTPDDARLILQFLQRADLKGTEVPAYVKAAQALEREIGGADKECGEDA